MSWTPAASSGTGLDWALIGFALASAVVTPLTVSVEDRTCNEGATGLASLLIVERVAAKAGELPAIPGEAIAPSARYRYTAQLANERVASWVTALGTVLDHPGKSAKYQVSPEGAVTVIPSESGVRDGEFLVALEVRERERTGIAMDQLIDPQTRPDPATWLAARGWKVTALHQRVLSS